eukprot:TRINITY_DN3092_c0_g1_i4.p1 TRINITY_DN3092_c0_g1~~TRINITY_DN3092_c0_g1_i4.p1  ORF type:complete len:121 (+),score=17.77 TRINITY_DN3092_c0_g1_i4:36-365(+)
MSEQQGNIEITQVDRINHHMLNAFKNHIESGRVQTFQSNEDGGDEDWDDSNYKHDDTPSYGTVSEDKSEGHSVDELVKQSTEAPFQTPDAAKPVSNDEVMRQDVSKEKQ